MAPQKIYLLRAPSIFKFIWSFAKQFFDQHIQDMISITNHSNYLDVISQDIDLQVLPAAVAPGIGTGQGMPGYFDHIIWELDRFPRLRN